MTLAEMKKKILRLIEEYDSTDTIDYTNDPDIAAKMNDVINQVQFELARIKKIPVKETIEVTDNQEYELTDLDNFYQLNVIRVKDSDGNALDYEVMGNLVTFPNAGTASIYYYKYPIRITDTTADAYNFELSDDVLEIMPYGVAGDLLKSDVSNAYGNVYAQRYTELKQQLDPRYNTGSIYIDGGTTL